MVEGDYVYVDKTKYIFSLFNRASYYFLSRPRRFGKSLLLDTISEVFSGDRELFKGLWIYGSDYDFEKYPVIRFDMSNIANKNSDALESALLLDLKIKIEAEGLSIDADSDPSGVFKRLILELHKKYNQRVVVLIDEYDKPILDHIDNVDTAEDNRKAIRGFYGILKSMDPYLKFTFLTGVSKFSKTSIFSELNNLMDITMTEDYVDICGFPVNSLKDSFGEHINSLAKHEMFKHFDSVHDEILAWYDG
ncbi:MAG: AAA family ATPase, partial [Oscillospiraceae bacterium]|nr:AAA family ATPase [Oscillospiraceae bacterium]